VDTVREEALPCLRLSLLDNRTAGSTLMLLVVESEVVVAGGRRISLSGVSDQGSPEVAFRL
jgi:hypothetical protein